MGDFQGILLWTNSDPEWRWKEAEKTGGGSSPPSPADAARTEPGPPPTAFHARHPPVARLSRGRAGLCPGRVHVVPMPCANQASPHFFPLFPLLPGSKVKCPAVFPKAVPFGGIGRAALCRGRAGTKRLCGSWRLPWSRPGRIRTLPGNAWFFLPGALQMLSPLGDFASGRQEKESFEALPFFLAPRPPFRYNSPR